MKRYNVSRYTLLGSILRNHTVRLHNNAKQYTIYFLLFIFYFLVSISCTNKKAEANEKVNKRKYVAEANPVDVMVLKKSVFKKELVSNGKLTAMQKSILKFRVSDELEKLFVKNGTRVNKGSKIASLSRFNQEQALKKAETRFKKAQLDLKDYLIGQAYKDASDSRITKEVMDVAKIAVGYNSAENDLKTARYNFAGVDLKAPFTGTIANLKKKEFEMVGSGEEFCTLIDDIVFEVEFEVLETEISEVKVGKQVKILPFSMSTSHLGSVSEINPVVDKNGLIKVKAKVKNPGNFLEGMNVKVLVESEVPNKLVVPKSAVLLRDNQEVLFTVKGGKAYWTYVQTGKENSTSYTVIAHPDKGATLQPGDTVITAGNLNLAHDSAVSF